MSIFGAFIVRIFLFRIFRIVLLSLHIQSEFGKIRTRKTPNTDTFRAVYIAIYLVYLFVYLFIYSIQLFIYLFVCLFIYFIYLYIYSFVYLFIYLFTFFKKTTIRNSLRQVFASFKVQIFIGMALTLFIILYCFRIEGFQSQCKVRAVYFCLNFLVQFGSLLTQTTSFKCFMNLKKAYPVREAEVILKVH